MKYNKQPLLSICIPTYNRAEILKRTLTKIVNDVDFDDSVEIVISDNASTDNTQQICQKFCESYSNIFYYRNKKNINDANFFHVLSKATGLYVKLNNDTISFRSGALKEIKNKIKQSSPNENLFFFQNNEFYSNNKIRFNSINEFMNTTNYYITWIANFGCWNQTLSQITTPEKYSEFKLTQVDWFLQLATKINYGIIHFGNYYNVENLTKKGGYNIYNVFINNFLYIIKQHNIKRITIEIQKYRLLRYFVFPWRKNLYKHPNLYTFDQKDGIKIILKNYWYYPYTYLFFMVESLKKII